MAGSPFLCRFRMFWAINRLGTLTPVPTVGSASLVRLATVLNVPKRARPLPFQLAAWPHESWTDNVLTNQLPTM